MASPSPPKHAHVSSETSSPSPAPALYPTVSAPAQTQQLHQPQQPTSQTSHDSMYQQQPLKEAVSMAFDKSDMSHQISPDLVKLVTEQVISNLKLNGISGARGNVPQKQQSAPAPSLSDSTPSIPPRDVYTPPSPDRDQLSNIGSVHTELQDSQTDGPGEKMPIAPRTGERGSISKDETRSQASPPPQGSPSSPTTLEKIWQPLFDDDNRPTARLGQFLRGLALHIIEDYEPRFSLVITPKKMQRFYDEVRLTEELYPWSDIFGGKMTPSSISHLYRDLKCQHHFVQRELDGKPQIPALTPYGFQCWMTHLIQAHPDEEFVRLAKATLDMPISNADNRRERFPKQLSRRLLPRQPNRSVRDLFEDSVLADPIIELPRRGSNPNQSGMSQSQHSQSGTGRPIASAPPEAQMPPPPQPSQPPPPQASHLAPSTTPAERDRKPYSASSSEVVAEDCNQGKPIERERQPYSAAPGGGKLYDSDDPSKANSKPQRANSVAGSGRPAPPPADEDLARSRQRRARTGSQSGPPPPGFMRPRRMRSPSVGNQSNPYVRSDGDMPPRAFNNANRASYIHDDSDNELERTYSRDTRDERVRRRMANEVPMGPSYPTQPKPMFDPNQYQRQQPPDMNQYPRQPPSDPGNGYGAANGYQYPPPPRYG